MKVQIENFQIIKKADLDIEGITFLVGNTNEGKSAVVRALEAAMYNRSGNEFIHYDEKRCNVEIEFPEDGEHRPLKVEWEKHVSGKARYEVNGTGYEKLNRTIPPELIESGIKEAELAKSKHRMMFWRQREPAFLVSETPSVIFEFMSKIMENRRILPVLKEMAASIKENKEEMVRLEERVKLIQGDIKQGERVVGVLGGIVAREGDIQRLTALRGDLMSLFRIREELGVAERVVEDITLAEERLRPVVGACVDSMKRLEVVRDGLVSLAPLAVKLNRVVADVDKLDIELKEIGWVESASPQFGQVDIGQYKMLRGMLVKLEASDDGLMKISELERQLIWVGQCRESIDKINVGDYKVMVERSVKIGSAERDIQGMEKESDSVQIEKDGAQARFQDFKAKMKVCPLCDSVIG